MIKVVKIGGNVIDDESKLSLFCKDFAALEGPKILVHGGGVMANGILGRMGIEPQMVEGRRVTDEQTLKVVTMVYSGWCNKHICALLQANGCNAIGLSGCDASVIKAERRKPRTLLDGKTSVDYGFVGDVCAQSVNADALLKLVVCGMVPVLCAINHDGLGHLLNTNADTVAQSVAAAVKGELVCCFECDGVLSDRNDSESVIGEIDEKEFERMKKDGTISEGMIPKIENCLKAVRSGAASAKIKSYEHLLVEGKGTIVSL